MGYKPKLTTASSTNLDISQLVPSKVIGGSYEPDFDFALKTALNKKNGAIIELVVSIESITPSKTLSSIKNS